jgi:hypothetical protein
VPTDELTPSELVVLALTAEAPAHGWALAVKLARGGEIGSIWSVGSDQRCREKEEERGVLHALFSPRQ